MKIIRKLALTLCLSLSISGVASAQQMRVGHDAAPDIKDNVTHAYVAAFGSAVELATNKEIIVDIYPNNQLGNSEDRLQNTRDGILHGTIASLGSLAPVYSDIDLLNLPFAFDNMAAVHRVFNGPFGKKLAQAIEKQLPEIVVLAIPDTGGFFAVTNSKKPIEKLEDFKNLRIRTMTVPAHQRLLQALGAQAYPLAWSELYTGLQTGVIDGQMNPIPLIYRAKLFEVQSKASLTKHLYNPVFFLVNREFFESLTEEQQDILRTAAEEGVIASQGLGRISEANDSVELSKKIDVNTPPKSEIERMRKVAVEAIDAYFEETLSDDGLILLDEFKAAIAEANAKIYLK